MTRKFVRRVSTPDSRAALMLPPTA
jgi:hypothetical protein